VISSKQLEGILSSSFPEQVGLSDLIEEVSRTKIGSFLYNGAPMDNKIEETAKAVQEVAKTARTGIEATRQVGSFVSKLINEPLEAVVGRLTDKVQFIRAERQVRLSERWREILRERNIEGVLGIVPPKLAFPIIENASLEEDDEYRTCGRIF
jgi:hypothetical protein